MSPAALHESVAWSVHGGCTSKPDHYATALLTLNCRRKTYDCRHRSHASMRSLEDDDRPPFLAVPRASSNCGGDRQGIPFDLEEAHLLAASPKLIPRNPNLTDDPVAT